MAGITLLFPPIVLFAIYGPPASAEALGRSLGLLLVPGFIAAMLTGLIARRSGQRWSWWRYVALVVPVQLLVFLLAATGASG
ncbi:MAG: hypothetical protein GEU98_25980 [Pseudonocardiaceae bacterium]|nr:hypothetical protein [Pseudonocardiaceae bacterium]